MDAGTRTATNDGHRSEDWLRWATILGCGALLFELISWNFVDIDLWHQMALIRESLAQGHLLKIDPYAYTPTVRPLIDHEWGAGVIAYFATRWFGGGAILLLKFSLAFATAFACVGCAKSRGADFRLLGLCAPLAICLAHLGFFAVIRAQAYTFFLAAIWLLLLERDRRGARSWIIVGLAIFPLWVNLHAGFVVALGLTALYAIEQLLRRNPARHLFLLLCGMSVEIFLNPYGPQYFIFLKRALTMARPYVAEWGPIWGLERPLAAAFIIAVIVAIYSVWSNGWQRSPGVLVLIATMVEAALHRKLLPLFAIAWFCYVPAYLPATAFGKWWSEFSLRRARFLTAAWLALACICMLAAVPRKPWQLAVPQPLYPVGPVQYLAQQHFTGNLMVPFRLGAYVSWKLYPAVKVSLDSRYEVAYPDPVVKQIFDFYDARRTWLATLAAYPTDAVLIPLDSQIAGQMPEAGWQRVYTDRQFQIYARPGLSLPAEDVSSTSFQGSFP